MSFLRIRKRFVVIIIALMVLIPTGRYIRVKYWGIELSPVEFLEKAELAEFPNTVNSVRFDGIRDGRVYLFAWTMFGFPKNFHYWVELDDLTPEQRLEIERRMAKEERAREARRR